MDNCLVHNLFLARLLQISCILPPWVCLAGFLILLICTRILNHQITKLKPSPKFSSIWLLYMSGCNWGFFCTFLQVQYTAWLGTTGVHSGVLMLTKYSPGILFWSWHFTVMKLYGQLISIVLHFLHTLVPWLSTASCLFFQKMP